MEIFLKYLLYYRAVGVTTSWEYQELKELGDGIYESNELIASKTINDFLRVISFLAEHVGVVLNGNFYPVQSFSRLNGWALYVKNSLLNSQRIHYF